MDNVSLADSISMMKKDIQAMEHRLEVTESLLSNAKEVLTVEEAAKFLGLSKSFVYKMTHEGLLPFYKPNGKVCYFERACNGQPDTYDATPHDNSHIYDGKTDAASVLDSQSPADTDRSSTPEATEGVSTTNTPMVSSDPIGEHSGNIQDRSVNRGDAAVMASDLFDGQERREPSKPDTETEYLVKNE